MKSQFAACFLCLATTLLLSITTRAQTTQMQNLTDKQKSVVTIAAFTASGDLPRLSQSLNEGLDSKLTINEIKEVLVQMYAYAGFPRSLNGIGTFMSVLDERKKGGIHDEEGKEPNPFPTGKSSIELGTENQMKLIGAPAAGAYIAFTPAIDQFLKGHLFGDIFGRDNLDFKTREIATIAALATLQGLDPQLQGHFRIALNIGMTEAELRSLIDVLATKVSQVQADKASQILDKVLNKGSKPSAKKVMQVAKLQIRRPDLDSYRAALNEEIQASIRNEPGVVSLEAVADQGDPTQITVFEIYANEDAYQSHLGSFHFKSYKVKTAEMVQSLQLIKVDPVSFGVN